jgi:hypothetical protein
LGAGGGLPGLLAGRLLIAGAPYLAARVCLALRGPLASGLQLLGLLFGCQVRRAGDHPLALGLLDPDQEDLLQPVAYRQFGCFDGKLQIPVPGDFNTR